MTTSASIACEPARSRLPERNGMSHATTSVRSHGRAHDRGIDAAERSGARNVVRRRPASPLDVHAGSSRPTTKISRDTCAQRFQLTIDDRARRPITRVPLFTPSKRAGASSGEDGCRQFAFFRHVQIVKIIRPGIGRRPCAPTSSLVPVVPMSEPRIGRVLVASLHQAIADVLPTRLEFYENWLNVSGLREGTIGLAPLSAVLELPAHRGDGVQPDHGTRRRVRRRVDGQRPSPLERRVIRALPAALRTRAALRTARALVRDDLPGLARHRSAAARDGVGRSARIAVLRGSRDVYSSAYAGSTPSAIARVLQLFDLPRGRAGQRVPRRRRPEGLSPVGRRSSARTPTSPPRRRDEQQAHEKRASRLFTVPPLRWSWLLPSALLVAPQPAVAQRAAPIACSSSPSRTRGHEPRLHWLGEASRRAPGGRTSTRAASARSRRDERVRAFEELHLPLTASLSRATVIKVGQLVGATEVIVGQFALDGGTTVRSTRTAIRIDVGRLEAEVSGSARR